MWMRKSWSRRFAARRGRPNSRARACSRCDLASRLRGASSGCGPWQLLNKVQNSLAIAARGSMTLDLRLIGGAQGNVWALLSQVWTDARRLAKLWTKPPILFALAAPLRRDISVQHACETIVQHVPTGPQLCRGRVWLGSGFLPRSLDAAALSPHKPRLAKA